MQRTALFLALALSASTAWSHTDSECHLRSDYDLTVEDSRLLFESERDGPTIAFANGAVTVDGQLLALGAADAERVQHFERVVRDLVPEVKAIAVEAVQLAGEAIKAVSASLSDDPGAVARIADRADELSAGVIAQIRSARSSRQLQDEHFEAAMEDLVEEMVPELVGSITSVAIKAALSGDMDAVDAIERRAKDLERTIEREVEQRAELIEARADALCERAQELDQIERSFEFHLPDGAPLDLIQTERGTRTAAL